MSFAEAIFQQEVHHRGSEKNSREPVSPGEIERTAADEKNGLPYGSRANLGKGCHAKQKRQYVQNSRSNIPPCVGGEPAAPPGGTLRLRSGQAHETPLAPRCDHTVKHYCVVVLLSHMSSRIPQKLVQCDPGCGFPSLAPATMTCSVRTGSVTKFRNLIDALDAAPGDRLFVTAWIDEDERETVTFAEFRRRARLQARVLRDHA